MQVKSVARNVAASPKKVRLILDHLPGRRVDEVLARLRFLPSPHARMVAKAVQSAAANAENNYQMDPRFLKVVAAYAGDGLRLKRWKARARGRVSRRVRRRAHITVVVEEMEG
jgi:large subunit ribosomal protein L22